jgi:hypothetical protein
MAEDVTLDLDHRPLTMLGLHYLLSTICGMEKAVIKNAARETAGEVMHRIELAIIAAHEARVRKAREWVEINTTAG